MSWDGRRLASYVDSDVTASYVYNESGIRTQKTVNGTTTDYFLSGSTILAEKTGSNITWYFYDSLGNPVGYEYGGAKYWYITNLQGDILYVVNSAGTPIGSYTYSPYGDFTATVLSSSDSTAFYANHLTYRGYYYDNETGLYYLNARYYDPQTGRFINADSQLNEGILGYNLFAYCGNNPMTGYDPSGCRPIWERNYGNGLIAYTDTGTGGHRNRNTTQNKNVGATQSYGDMSSNRDLIDSKVPPNPESGYVPPKKNPNPGKVNNPNGAGKGWPANDGGVWIPNNKQDGGPGWTVQYPGGRHVHRYPDGHKRSHDFANSYSNIANTIIGGTIIISAGIGIIFIMTDDVTGIGTLNDVSLPVLFDVFSMGVQLIA